MPANVGEMFYYGQCPWHGLGNKLEQPATIETALKAGGLDWTVGKEAIMTAGPRPTEISKRVAIVRTDRQAGDPSRVLGVVYPGFTPLQNRDGMQIFDRLLGAGRPHYHTGGYLGNGETVWLLAKLDRQIKVADGDVVKPYMLYANSHDGSIAVNLRLTTVRVVCENTLNLAFRNSKKIEVFTHKHAGDYREIEEMANGFFKMYKEAISGAEQTFQALHAFRFSKDLFRDYAERLIPLPAPPRGLNIAGRAKAQYETRLANIAEIRKTILDIHARGLNHGLNIPPAEETLWGALNTITAYVDHAQHIKGDRYAHILFGQGARLKQKAYALALEHGGVKP